MKFSVLRLATLLVTAVFAAGLWSSTAAAQVDLSQPWKYSLTGNSRAQIGDGLPIPIGFTGAPNGRIHAVPNATVIQPPGPDPKTIIMKPGQMKNAVFPINIGLFLQNNKLFEVHTTVGLSAPGQPTGTATYGTGLRAGGRTGASTVQFCAGQSVTPTGNPMCAHPSLGAINGIMRYTKTANQFGGKGNSYVTGAAIVVGVAGGAPPCTWSPGTPPVQCTAIFALATPASQGAQGAAFGHQNTTLGVTPNPGIAFVAANSKGTITSVIAAFGTGLTNAGSSYGGPWTTGQLSVTVTAAVPPETFALSGADNRVGGRGSISLVAGALATRAASGPNANRGWMNLVIGDIIPAVSPPGLAAACGLLALAGGYALRRWVR